MPILGYDTAGLAWWGSDTIKMGTHDITDDGIGVETVSPVGKVSISDAGVGSETILRTIRTFKETQSCTN